MDEVKTIVFTISQQPILSLAHRYEMNPEDCSRHLAGYFKSLGADYILSTKISDDLALIESRVEFIERFRNQSSDSKNKQLPMLSSSCPGWVCYAEKTHGNFILPYISSTRSPQQIMGVLVKQFLAQKLNVAGSRIYHVTIMPCYDKKLEASREDFFSEVNNSRDVDCVITSSKFLWHIFQVYMLWMYVYGLFVFQSKLSKCWKRMKNHLYRSSRLRLTGHGILHSQNWMSGHMRVPDRVVILIIFLNTLLKNYLEMNLADWTIKI